MNIAKLLKVQSRSAGLPPGSLVYVGEHEGPTRVKVMEFSGETLREKEVDDPAQCARCREPGVLTWVDAHGLRDAAFLEKLGDLYGLHPLILEDIVSVAQRPKLEDMDDYLFVSVRMLYPSEESDDEAIEIRSEQFSLVLGHDFVLTFQENGDARDVLEPIRTRLRSGKGRLRRLGADYLAYALLDAVVDGYFLALERLGEELEDMHDEVIADPTGDDLAYIHELRRTINFLRRAAWPLREVLGSLHRGDTPLISRETLFYIKDVYDHAIQIIDVIESFRDTAAGLMEVYLSSLSMRLNSVMKVLTIISTIFMPLTFIAGVYGMNFEHMPELKWQWGYYLTLGLCVGVAGLMLLYFRRLKWL